MEVEKDTVKRKVPKLHVPKPHLHRRRGSRHVHLVCEEKNRKLALLELRRLEDRIELVLRDDKTNPVRAVDDKHDRLGVLEVMLPQVPVAILARHVERGELHPILRELLRV